ncbi:MAG: PAS domain-containing protein [Candidatus Gracilibacteria bacterium]|jgi:hypothetical protein
MINFSQEKKIAISVIVIFVISFSVMALVLQKNNAGNMRASVTNASNSQGHGAQTNTLGSHSSAELAVVKEENPYAKYVNSKETPFFILNSSGELEYSSEKFCEFMDIKCEELENKVFFEYINSKDLVKLVSEYTKVIHDQKEIYAIGPYRLNAKSDEKIILFDVLPILSAEKEKVEKLLFAINDITKKVEEMKDKTESGNEGEKAEDSENKEDSSNKEMEKTVGFHLNLIGKLF